MRDARGTLSVSGTARAREEFFTELRTAYQEKEFKERLRQYEPFLDRKILEGWYLDEGEAWGEDQESSFNIWNIDFATTPVFSDTRRVYSYVTMLHDEGFEARSSCMRIETNVPGSENMIRLYEWTGLEMFDMEKKLMFQVEREVEHPYLGQFSISDCHLPGDPGLKDISEENIQLKRPVMYRVFHKNRRPSPPFKAAVDTFINGRSVTQSGYISLKHQHCGVEDLQSMYEVFSPFFSQLQLSLSSPRHASLISFLAGFPPEEMLGEVKIGPRPDSRRSTGSKVDEVTFSQWRRTWVKEDSKLKSFIGYSQPPWIAASTFFDKLIQREVHQLELRLKDTQFATSLVRIVVEYLTDIEAALEVNRDQLITRSTSRREMRRSRFKKRSKRDDQ